MSKQTDLINIPDAITVSGSNVGIGTSSPAGLQSWAKGTRILDLKLETTPVTGDVGIQFRANTGAYLGLAAGGGTGIGIVIHSNNKVGIGAVPSSPLHVNVGTNQNLEIDSASSELRLSAVNDARSTNPAIRFQADSYKFYGAGGVGPRATIDSSGNVVIGTGSSLAKMTVIDTTDATKQIVFGNHTSYYGSIGHDAGTGTNYYITETAGNHKFMMGTTERMRIDNSGRLFVGKTVNSIGTAGTVISTVDGVRAAVANDPALLLGRTGSDGTIANFYRDTTSVGTIGTLGNYLTIGDEDTSIRFHAGVDSILPHNSTTNANRDASINLGTSTARFKDAYLSGGIYLGGTGSANKLDDYEEGTFTPSVSVGDATTKIGVYTKVGRLVTIQCKIRGFTNTSNNEVLIIGNLPFTIGQTSKAIGSAMWAFVDTDNAYGVVYAVSGNALAFYSASENNDFDSLRCIDMDSSLNTTVYFSGTYMAT